MGQARDTKIEAGACSVKFTALCSHVSHVQRWANRDCRFVEKSGGGEWREKQSERPWGSYETQEGSVHLTINHLELMLGFFFFCSFYFFCSKKAVPDPNNMPVTGPAQAKFWRCSQFMLLFLSSFHSLLLASRRANLF